MADDERPSEPTGAEFLQSLRQCGLSSSTELPPSASGRELAEQLVREGKLTRYQAEAILSRRFDDLLMGNYEILDRLGAGGMGTVFKARHRRMKRVVAIKVLTPEVAKSEAFVQRFQREVETIARLTHPNIVMAFDADEAKGGPFLVMEFVNGRDLATEVATGGPLSVVDAVDCVLQAARGLEYSHAQGIVHRDIKPGNLIRDVSGVLKVADLGLARLNHPGGSPGDNTSLTQAGGIVGTLDYMAPEQALDSTAIDHRVDIYSLGCTLHFMLTGRPPYAAGSLMALLLKHREAPIPSLAPARPDISTDLNALFQQMVAKHPDDRPATMTELARALEELKNTLRLADSRPFAPAAKTDNDMDSVTATGIYEPAESGSVRSRDTHALSGDPTGAVRAESGRAIVLAEPSATQAGIIRRYLQQLGIEQIHPAKSGWEAIRIARRERADVILCSMYLTDMTGVQLARALLSDGARVGIGLVLATSEADTGVTAALPQSPRVVLLPKPFDLERLSQAIAQAIS